VTNKNLEEDMRIIADKNEVILVGRLEHKKFFSQKRNGEKIFTNYLLVERLSGTVDRIPIKIWESFFTTIPSEVWKEKVQVRGNILTYLENFCLHVTILVEEVFPMSNQDKDVNQVSLGGTIRSSNYRITPFGRRITDFILISKRRNGKYSNVPTIVWGRYADSLKDVEDGSKIYINGRLQSRKYQKKLKDGSYEEREINELSTSWYQLM